MMIGKHYRTGRLVRLDAENGHIAAIVGLDGGDPPDEDRPPIVQDSDRNGFGRQERRFDPKGRGAILAPGLVDLQINGFRGIDFNAPHITETAVAEMTKALWKEGVTSYFPTVITNDDERIEAAVRAIGRACARDELVNLSIPGIHLEGPFISPHDGPRGAHPKACVKAPDWSLVERWQQAAMGKIRLITLSPEWPGSAEFIRQCRAHGIAVSIGHTAATPEEIREAVAAGAMLSTHLGNGAHPMLPRHPNYIWEQLADERLWCCLIADGFHLPDSVIKVFMKAKGERAVLVSDAVHVCGMPAGTYRTHIGGTVVLTPEGRLHMADRPDLLAGSAQLLPWSIGRLARERLCGFAEAWEMASTRPAEALGLPAAWGLSAGAPADAVLLDIDDVGQIRILRTMKSGKIVYSAG
jgi:N-acetylglucosamine-6-phosphate deacetylase